MEPKPNKLTPEEKLKKWRKYFYSNRRMQRDALIDFVKRFRRLPAHLFEEGKNEKTKT